MKKKLIVIAGPTASGKTAVSVELAKRIGGEVISADSMQIYKYMDIGSAKVTEEEKQGISHYLVDELMPDEPFSVQRFQEMAKNAMDTIYGHGNIPVVAGGTGFYIQALVKDVDFTVTDKEAKIRVEVEQYYLDNGKTALYKWLKEVDEEATEIIHENNVKRVKRYLEYYLLTGEKMSQHNQEEMAKESPYDVSFFVLTMERDFLYHRINKRVDKMIEAGLVEEVKQLKTMGYDKTMVSMQGLGYKELLEHLDGDISLDEAVYKIKRDTRRFAKRQLTWFRREKDVKWIHVDYFGFDVEKICEEILKSINNPTF